MLIISNPACLAYIQPLVNWKNKKGIPRKLVSTTETGSSSSNISNYIEDYYFDNGLTFVLLVGD